MGILWLGSKDIQKGILQSLLTFTDGIALKRGQNRGINKTGTVPWSESNGAELALRRMTHWKLQKPGAV